MQVGLYYLTLLVQGLICKLEKSEICNLEEGWEFSARIEIDLDWGE